MYAIDQQKNPTTVVLSPGGVGTDGHLLAGRLGTATDDETSLALYRRVRKVLTSRFERIRSFWVGDEAGRLLDNGTRLRPTRDSLPVIDL